jgi:hypothetical protein
MKERLAMIALLLAGCTTAREVEGRRGDNPIHEDHRTLIVERKYDFGLCAKCHDDGFCRKCHSEGPTGCTTCHGMPPRSGAHVAHSKRFDCSECHTKPAAWSDPGHVLLADGEIDPAPAEVKLPGYKDGTCENKCHGTARPGWNDGPKGAACGTCHGIPPQNHFAGTCETCHPRTIADISSHVDGKVSLGDESGTCLACHPKPGGAHTSHTAATHALSAPLACSRCHTVPAALLDPGHLSGVAEHSACTPCHGTSTPAWAPSPAGYACGSCHGVPPANATHAGAKLLDCWKCHPSTMDSSGALLPAAHVNGVVDAQ